MRGAAEEDGAVFGERPRARILLEASTESEWVARHLESLGHDVIVADPNDAPMYANRSRRTKTDKRDARTLMDACEMGAWRPAYRLSEARRHVRAELAVCDALVRTRTRYIALAKALVRRDGLRVPTSASAWVPTRIAALELSPTLTTELEPLFAVFAPLIGVVAGVVAAGVLPTVVRPRLTPLVRTTRFAMCQLSRSALSLPAASFTKASSICTIFRARDSFWVSPVVVPLILTRPCAPS